MDTLLLNADGKPISLIPLSAVSWQDAMRLTFTGKAKVISYHEDWVVNTAHSPFRVPSIIMSTVYFRPKTGVRYNRSNVFLRDNYQCQICGGVFDHRDLTIDHVMPRSLGGGTNWANVTTACMDCNSRKGNDASILPINKPYRPTYYDLVRNRKKLPIHINDLEWNTFLQWPEELIHVRGKNEHNDK